MSTTLLGHIRKYIDLDEQEEKVIIAYIEQLQVKKKGYLLKEGQLCKASYFVEKGCLRMFFISDKGDENTVNFALENWWISDYSTLLTQKPSLFYIQAIEHSDILMLTAERQEELLKEIPKIERYFRLILQRAYGASQMRFKHTYNLSREDMYRNFLGLHPEFVNRVPQYMLASYLGFTPEYLSEIRKKKI
ncbi:Crp/Fnr family transcriptional regulator [Emticicia sp. BO119]|uniref:Crp/Fnr family transcriptional regulator n=1 Tax=Emticicia sp. BO119 TaxID=2757768 RepID=UPI0015F01550|nr:Crp/Fnr family transcriptional regulator [Emticicia sp. BO119]MBA4853068.1 Crp/Fnr family transcriptional regulator [Emticicia sp. BO119]